MKTKNRIARLKARQTAWDKMSAEDKKGTRRPGSMKRSSPVREA